MAINFGAMYMEGYNYPHIIVLQAALDETGEKFVKFPTFNDLERVLSRNIVPVLALENPATQLSHMCHLTAFNNDSIIFTAIYSPTITKVVMFTRGQNEPIIG